MSAWRVVVAAACLAVSGCGLTYQVDTELLLGVALEHKVSLFDAENDVSISVDEREAITNEIRETYRDINAAEAQIAEAISDGERAQFKGNTEKVELALLAADVFALKIDYLEDKVDFLREKRQLQDLIVLVAMARYELEKAKLVKKINVRGSEGIDLADFEGQVDDMVEKARSAQEALALTAQEVEEVKGIWLAQRDALNQASGGGLGSPWAEEGGLWGSQ